MKRISRLTRTAATVVAVAVVGGAAMAGCGSSADTDNPPAPSGTVSSEAEDGGAGAGTDADTDTGADAGDETDIIKQIEPDSEVGVSDIQDMLGDDTMWEIVQGQLDRDYTKIERDGDTVDLWLDQDFDEDRAPIECNKPGTVIGMVLEGDYTLMMHFNDKTVNCTELLAEFFG